MDTKIVFSTDGSDIMSNEIHEVGHCSNCNVQWVINGDSDKKECPFCQSTDIYIEDETNEQDR